MEQKILLSPIDIDLLVDRCTARFSDILVNSQKAQLEEKLLSPERTCNLFEPKISKVTLHKWTKDGRLKEHRIGGRIYYKYSEVMASLQTLKKYSKVS